MGVKTYIVVTPPALKMFGKAETELKHVGVIACSNSDKEKTFKTMEELVAMQVKLGLTVLTISIHPNDYGDEMKEFLIKLNESELVKQNQIKVMVLGKWYDLESEMVDAIKNIISETKDYDKHFLNLCINYDGQESIVNACKMIARMTKADKMDPESVSKSDVKENIYSSFFIPPDVIIKTGKILRLNGFLLWDSTRSLIYFTEKPWSEFDAKEMERIIKSY